jgi:hypothetical protein
LSRYSLRFEKDLRFMLNSKHSVTTCAQSFAAAVCLMLSAFAIHAQEITSPVSVTVDASKTGNFLAPRAFGIHTSIYDNAMQSQGLTDLLKNDGIYTLRYPGGGYADIYHWSQNKLNTWKATSDKGYLAKGTDFGSFVHLIDRLGGTAVITVNYGTNQQGTGGGEPIEAAAWVAYANGKPDDQRPLGKDSTGIDWKTVGYWATMRSSAPLAEDDGYNFLRLSHPQQLNIKYWEIGNELFGNGYYAKDGSGYENDLHVPYDKDARQDAGIRAHNQKLSPVAYGQGVVQFSRAMKEVDPRISIGAILNTPPMDYSWGRDWDSSILAACATSIDFVSIHWYTGGLLPPDWKNLDNASFLAAPTVELPQMAGELLALFKQYAPGRNLQLAITELGSRPYAKITDPLVLGLFAADTYASLAEDGAINIDWLELHQDSFLGEKNNSPGAAYFGIQMAHHLLNMRDFFIAAKSSNDLVAVHAAKHADGSIGLLLVNKDPKNAATVRVKISGVALTTRGTRYDWGKSAPSEGNNVRTTAADNLGNSFITTVSAYTVTALTIQPAAH